MDIWISPKQSSIGSILSPKTTHNLMQNCDLPPPIKLLSFPDYTFFSFIHKNDNIKRDQDHHLLQTTKDISENNDKLELLKALRLSQTRAREAERKLSVLNKEKNELSNLLAKESFRLFAHRNWVRLLEFEVMKLQSEYGQRWEDCDDDDDDQSSNSWCVALVCCLAIAGMGFAIFSDFSFDSNHGLDYITIS